MHTYLCISGPASFTADPKESYFEPAWFKAQNSLCRRAGDAETEEALEGPEVVIPLEEQITQFWDFSAPFDGFSVSIRPPTNEMPLLKQLGEASFVPTPGIEAILSSSYHRISKKGIETAYRESEGAE